MLIIIGPSASGKTEVAKILASKYNITKIVTYTTRTIRINEVNGVDYNFVSKDEFLKLKEESFFVETTCYNDNYYGTAKKDIKDDKCVVLDPNGLDSFNALNDKRIISIYLNTKEEIRYQRMIDRQDGIDKVNSRIENDRIAFSKENLKGITLEIDNNDVSLEKLSDKVYQMYMDKLGEIK